MNSLFVLALRNVFRQRIRSAATLSAIAIGVAGLILSGGFVQDIFYQLGEAIIYAQTGHLQVTKEGFREGKNRSPESYLIEKPGELNALLEGVAGVQKVFNRLNFVGVLNNGKRDLGIVGEGIESSAEGKVSTYLRYIDGRPLDDKDLGGMVVGQGVAKSMGLKVGDRANLVVSLSQGAVNTLDYEVVGVFQSFSKEFDARAVRIQIAGARELLDTSGSHVVVAMIRDTAHTRRIEQNMRARLAGKGFEVKAWMDLSDFYTKAVDLYDRQFGVLRMIILLMVLLSVANSVNMTLFERTREFGTMLALGNRPSTVFKQILVEGLIVGVIGAAIGVLLGCSLAMGISAIGIPMPPPPNANLGYTATIRLNVFDVLTAGCIGLVATCLATIMPARRASRMPVVDALRQGV